jgi:hypothetical protein
MDGTAEIVPISSHSIHTSVVFTEYARYQQLKFVSVKVENAVPNKA